jgi:hypothetical protein
LKTAIGAILSVLVTMLRHGAVDGLSLPVIFSGFYEVANLTRMAKNWLLAGANTKRFSLERISQAKQSAAAMPGFRACIDFVMSQ